ncbi:MAG: zinc-dependent alcohol dehydrogenase [Candidatus Thorarchaeota archaeon]
MSKMRAAVFEKAGMLEIKDIPKPSPGHEEALIKMITSGVCHSDLHMAHGDWPNILTPPFTLGHEGIGIVEELGPDAEGVVQKGDRVILGLGGAGGGYWCGACEDCLAGRPMFCEHTKMAMGTFGEYMPIWVKGLVKLPDEVSDSEVPLACGGLTAYSAVKKLIKFGVSPGKPVAIIGAAGGLGHYAVQIAKALGYNVIGVDIGEEKLEFVKKMGADHAIEANKVSGFVAKSYGGGYTNGVHASIVFSPKIAGFSLGIRILRRGGIFVGVGLPAMKEGTVPLMPLEFVGKGLHLIGSAVGTVEEMRELVQLAADGKVKTHIGRTANLSEINQVFEELEQGKYVGRAIIDNFTK